MFKMQIPIDSFIVKDIAKQLVVRELRMYFSRIRKSDESYSFKKLDSFDDE